MRLSGTAMPRRIAMTTMMGGRDAEAINVDYATAIAEFSLEKRVFQMPISPGQWAPHLDDPDLPEVMSPEAAKAAARKIRALLKKKAGEEADLPKEVQVR